MPIKVLILGRGGFGVLGFLGGIADLIFMGAGIFLTKVVKLLGNGQKLFREYCFGRKNSLISVANSVSSARNSVTSLWHTNARLTETH